MAKKVIVFLADGFEEIEALTTVDLLRRAGMEVTTASVMENRGVMGSHKVFVRADIMAARRSCSSTWAVSLSALLRTEKGRLLSTVSAFLAPFSVIL